MPTSLLPERIVVALDGAVFGERSLPVASDVAGAIGVDLVLLSVVEYPDDWQDRAIYLDGLRRRYDASSVALLLEPDARRTLARRQSDELPCLATRAPTSLNSGEPRALLHSHVADLVGRVDVPVLAVPSRQSAPANSPGRALH